MTPPKSLITAVGVKNRPSAMILRFSSMLMKMTKTYSPIWNRFSQHCPFIASSIVFLLPPINPVLLPAAWGHAWPWWRVTQTSWRCRSRWLPQSSPSPNMWPGPEDHWKDAEKYSVRQKHNIFFLLHTLGRDGSAVTGSRKLFGLQTRAYWENFKEKAGSLNREGDYVRKGIRKWEWINYCMYEEDGLLYSGMSGKNSPSTSGIWYNWLPVILLIRLCAWLDYNQLT